MKKQIFKVGSLLVAILTIAYSGVVLAQTASSSPTCSMTITPSSGIGSTGATLSWTSTNADTAVFNQGVGTTSPFSVTYGSMQVLPLGSTTYTGVFSGINGSTSCTAFFYGGASTSPATTSSSTIPAQGTGTIPTLLTNPSLTSSVTPTSSGSNTGTGGSQILYPALGSTPAPMIIRVDASRNVLIRGVVLSSGTNMITITSWGGTWTVRTSGASQTIPTNPNPGDMSAFMVGHFVGVQGTIAADRPYTVDASLVRDWTTSQTASVSTSPSISASGSTNSSNPSATIIY